MSTRIAETPWLLDGPAGFWCDGSVFGYAVRFVCRDLLSKYFDVEGAKQVKLVAHREPGDGRYEVWLPADDVTAKVLTEDGEDAEMLTTWLRRYLKRFGLSDIDGPIYVECWVKRGARHEQANTRKSRR